MPDPGWFDPKMNPTSQRDPPLPFSSIPKNRGMNRSIFYRRVVQFWEAHPRFLLPLQNWSDALGITGSINSMDAPDLLPLSMRNLQHSQSQHFSSPFGDGWLQPVLSELLAGNLAISRSTLFLGNSSSSSKTQVVPRKGSRVGNPGTTRSKWGFLENVEFLGARWKKQNSSVSS